MEIKVGQWVRDDWNNIGIVTNVLDRGAIYFDNIDSHMLRFPDQNEIIKVADTPQELIQVGDLVYGDGYITPREVYSVNIKEGNVTIIEHEYYTYKLDTITKILTPNSNGGYDLQWRKDNVI